VVARSARYPTDLRKLIGAPPGDACDQDCSASGFGNIGQQVRSAFDLFSVACLGACRQRDQSPNL
jgi:hypothetical protein